MGKIRRCLPQDSSKALWTYDNIEVDIIHRRLKHCFSCNPDVHCDNFYATMHWAKSARFINYSLCMMPAVTKGLGSQPHMQAIFDLIWVLYTLENQTVRIDILEEDIIPRCYEVLAAFEGFFPLVEMQSTKH